MVQYIIQMIVFPSYKLRGGGGVLPYLGMVRTFCDDDPLQLGPNCMPELYRINLFFSASKQE